ncbi:MAG: 16S rRNA (cytosine(967)-C(5))-methyltransferase RsmB [Thermodesulfovibrio sp.]|nr:16S rRNA (cytosine(967)-C(5))-methyltransferase RsmB [Thermodesulfovibrio sp.]
MPGVRLQATEALVRIFSGDIRPKPAIETISPSLDRRDRAFLMEIVYGVLRYRDTLDWILGHFLKKPDSLDTRTVNNLRTAIYQLYFMRVPERAVVNEAVEVEKCFGQKDRSAQPSLVNAVLRNIIRQKDQFALPLKPEKQDSPASEIALNTSHPRWLVRHWIKRFGEDEARLLAAANNMRPPFTLRTNTLRTTRGALLEQCRQEGMPVSPTRYAPEGITVDGQVAYDDLSFARGLFSVQDEASQLIPLLLNPQPGERVLDACAAPGGKTTHIAQMMGDRGEIIAVEKDPKRLAHLRENISTLGLTSVKVINADVTEPGERRTFDQIPFDRILLDAPCSATGVIRRNPDVKYRHKAADLLLFREKQLQLLKTVSRFLKKEGTMVYAVCSTEPEEGEQVIEEFLKTDREFRIIDADAPLLKEFISGGILRTFPHRHNMDGFFGVTLCRRD